MGREGARVANIPVEVFNTNQTISTDLNTDIGQLKALVLARGDRRGTYEDLEDKDYYNENIAQSVIVNIQGEFDRLINSVVESINKVLEEASDKTPGGYLSNEDGSALQLFVKKNGEDSKFTIMNISVNQDLIEQPTKLGFVKEDGSVDYETAEKLKAAFEAEEYTLNPNVIKKSNFMDFYSDLVSQVGNSGAVYRSIVDNQQQMVLATDNSRQQVIGVSTDEELSNMIRFQNGYNAASRYINAISEMLEHLITRLT